ncbi:ABC transporter substrate-binding protein [Microlunatus sp. GCM10028923]|uniref:ABC transporter substrate-binding protein n=1 Tax=Microlunatus sp. GCM10028923 TaxID=3273400 RepID=UPI00360E3D8C
MAGPRLLIMVLALLVAAGGCAAPAVPADRPADGAAPVTVQNCGVTTIYPEPPKSILAMNVTAVETMIMLGAGDRLIGRQTETDDPRPVPEAAAAFDRLEVLGKANLSGEKIADLGPELVVAGWDLFDEDEGRSRDQLRGYGIDTFGFTEYCAGGFAGFETLEKDLRDLGAILGQSDRAEKLITDLRGRLEQARSGLDGVQPVRTFYYDSGTDAPYTPGGPGVLSFIADQAKAPSVINDGQRPFVTASWEQVADQQPEVIVILDYPYSGTVADKIKILEANPVMATTPAVRQRRYVTLGLYDTFEGVRIPGAVEHLAEAVHGKRPR